MWFVLGSFSAEVLPASIYTLAKEPTMGKPLRHDASLWTKAQQFYFRQQKGPIMAEWSPPQAARLVLECRKPSVQLSGGGGPATSSMRSVNPKRNADSISSDEANVYLFLYIHICCQIYTYKKKKKKYIYICIYIHTSFARHAPDQYQQRGQLLQITNIGKNMH